MDQTKETYYVDLVSESILPDPLESTSFMVQANRQEIHALKTVLEKKHEADMETYVRSHIPFLEYHHDPENDRYDAQQKMLYAIIYQLGDDAARAHIAQMGILTDRKEDDPEDIRNLR